MNDYCFAVVAVLITLTFVANNFQVNAGQNYIATIEKVEDVEVPMGVERVLINENVKVIGRQHYLNGTFVFTVDLDNDHYKMSAELLSSPIGNGMYRKTGLFVPPTGVCEALLKFYRDYIQPSIVPGVNSNIPHIPEEGLCPLPAGSYYFKDLLFNTDSWPNHLPHGMLKCVLTFYHEDQVCGGISYYLNIEAATR